MRKLSVVIALLLAYLPLSGQDLPWQVNPSAFAYQATATVQIRVDYESGTSPMGTLGAFKGTQIHGVADAVQVDGEYLYFISLYSNSPKDTIQFRFALEESGAILIRDTLFAFEQATIYGSVDQPLLVDFVQNYNYAPVWKPIPDVVLPIGQTYYQTDLTPWVSDYENEQFRISVTTQGPIRATVSDEYLLELDIPASFVGSQKFVLSAFTTGQTSPPGIIEWSVHVQADDIAPVSLVSSLPVNLFQGEEAYSVSLATLFTSEDNQALEFDVVLPNSEEILSPQWSVSPESFEYNMNITLKASVLGIESTDDTLLIAAFSGDQVRGISSAVRINDSLRYFLVAYSNVVQEPLEFKVWSKTSSKVYSSPFTTVFNPLQALGTVDEPLDLTFGPFTATIDQNWVHISSDFTQSGTDTVLIKATELGREPALYTLLSVPVTVYAVSKPKFGSFTGEVVVDDQLFKSIDLDTLITNGDQSEVSISVRTIQADEGYSFQLSEDNILSVTAGEAFGKIELLLTVFRVDNAAIGDSIRLVFERKASYLPPSSVLLLSPEKDETMPNGSIRFTWSASKGGTLMPEYILRIQPKGGLVNSIRGLRDTVYVLDSVEAMPDSAAYTWWVTTTDGRTSVESETKNPFGVNIYVSNEAVQQPLKTAITQTYPNPFNPSTRLVFDLATSQQIRIDVFDMTGKKVQTVFSGLKNSGQHQLLINGSSWSSGMYLIQMTTAEGVFTKKVVLIK